MEQSQTVCAAELFPNRLRNRLRPQTTRHEVREINEICSVRFNTRRARSVINSEEHSSIAAGDL